MINSLILSHQAIQRSPFFNKYIDRSKHLIHLGVLCRFFFYKRQKIQQNIKSANAYMQELVFYVLPLLDASLFSLPVGLQKTPEPGVIYNQYPPSSHVGYL